jgi:hypothetical protein
MAAAAQPQRRLPVTMPEDVMTDQPQQYLRRCNGQPDGGLPTTRDAVKHAVRQAGNHSIDPRGIVTWFTDGGQRRFTAEPVHTDTTDQTGQTHRGN